MDGSGESWITTKIWDALVGIEMGIIGGFLMLLWLSLSAPLMGQPWWTTWNLLASHYYPYNAVRSGPGMATLSGVGLELALSGLFGAFSGIFSPGGRLFGLGVAIAWYLLSYFWLWRKLAPLLLIYGSQPLLIIGFFLYGSTLGWHPELRKLTRHD